LNFVAIGDDHYFDQEKQSDDVFYGAYVVWLTRAGRELAMATSGQLQSVLDKKSDALQRRDAATEKRIEEARHTKRKSLQKLEDQGGQIVDGLYHGDRRVRAITKDDKWQLSGDEEDLINAIGKTTILVDANRVDLRSRHGLQIKRGLAPVEVNIDESGFISIERSDEWGQGARLFEDHRTIRQKLGVESIARL
jgi:hypothetical protein